VVAISVYPAANFPPDKGTGFKNLDFMTGID
jgi:hypothetical protein